MSSPPAPPPIGDRAGVRGYARCPGRRSARLLEGDEAELVPSAAARDLQLIDPVATDRREAHLGTRAGVVVARHADHTDRERVAPAVRALPVRDREC